MVRARKIKRPRVAVYVGVRGIKKENNNKLYYNTINACGKCINRW